MGHGLLAVKSLQLHSDTLHSEGVFWTSYKPEQRPVPENKQLKKTDIHAPGGIQTHNPSMQVATDSGLAHAATWINYTTIYL